MSPIMRRTPRVYGLTLLLVVGLYLPVSAQTTSVKFPVIGSVAPRHASEIKASNWSVGAETMDRDYTLYDNWKDHLGPLGVKKARIQAGWAKTEQEKGKYDWAWLDNIIPDMHRQGVEPWVNLSYGNPLYTTSTGDSRGDMPQTEEAWEAWLRFVSRFVSRYEAYVDEWEIWNEPRLAKSITPAAYAALVERTAEAVKKVQPEARILILALDDSHFEAQTDEKACKEHRRTRAEGTFDCNYARKVLERLSETGNLHLVDEVTFHPYAFNPDDVYEGVEVFRRLAASFDPRIRIRQGENGVPSEVNRNRALADYPWTETAQAKWALRRMLGDLGHDLESSYFSIADMKYPEEINRKGLLFINQDKEVVRRKPAYEAVQHLTAIFDHSLNRVLDFEWAADTDSSVSAFAYRKAGGEYVVALWFDGSVPSDSYGRMGVDLTFPEIPFTDPVYVDLLGGTVHDIPDDQWRRQGMGSHFTRIPLYDSPVLVAERSIIPH